MTYPTVSHSMWFHITAEQTVTTPRPHSHINFRFSGRRSYRRFTNSSTNQSQRKSGLLNHLGGLTLTSHINPNFSIGHRNE